MHKTKLMRDFNQKKKELQKVKVIPLYYERKTELSKTINFIIIAILFVFFIILSIRSSNLFLKEILLCKAIISLLCILQFMSKNDK